ncbi:response regulator [Roseovarius salis]|uniref:response regulator n=1 Tax=Roseovarius salis TaxID=3376063 RepID=UPI0037CAE444
MRLLIADDHDLVRETIGAFLEAQSDARVEKARTLDHACQRVADDGPFDLVLLDYDMPGMDGLNGLVRMLELNGGKPVAMLSGAASRAVAQQALGMGAAGFISKTMNARSMLHAVRFMVSGEVFAPLDLLGDGDDGNAWNLTDRERDVLLRLCQGKANKEIANDLGVSLVTVKMHVRSLTRKMDAKNRTHAAMMAREKRMF